MALTEIQQWFVGDSRHPHLVRSRHRSCAVYPWESDLDNVIEFLTISSHQPVNADVGRARKRISVAEQKIRIRLKAYDHEAIDASAKKIVETVTRTGARVVGPVPLPTEKNVYCVIRSPHKYKDSREHFEMRTHKRMIEILDPTPKTVDALMRIDLPASVDVNIQ